MAGARRRAENDERLLEQMSDVLDSLYAYFATNETDKTGSRS